MKKKCDLCQKEENEIDLFHYDHLVGDIPEDILICEECLFDCVEKDFQCDDCQTEVLKIKIA
nr:hypothetical protein [uncultured Draconibacterium sp.]